MPMGLSLGLGLGLTAGGAAGVPQVIQSGLVAEWRFDDGSGQVLTDYSGNGHHGQLGSTAGADATDPVWTAKGLQFDDSDDFVRAASVPEHLAAFTMTCALRTDDLTKNRMCLSTEVTNGQSFRLRSSNKDALGVNSDGSTVTSTANLIVVGDPLVLTWTFDTADGGRIFKNGQQDAHDAAGITPASASGNFTIGQRADNAGASINGEIFYALFYSRRITPTEVTQNYDVIKATLASRGVVLP